MDRAGAKFFDEHRIHDVGILSVHPRSGVVSGSASQMCDGGVISIEHNGVRFYGGIAHELR
jgi:hypothetical protein